MADCSFQFKTETDTAEIIAKVKSKIESEGGSFTADENKGNFNLPTPVGAIEGSYSIDGNELKIDITKKPMMLPCSMIESELQKRLK